MDGLKRKWSALRPIGLVRPLEVYSYCHGVEAIGFEFGDIGCTDAVGLDAVDVDDEVLPIHR